MEISYTFWCLYITVLLRLLEIHFAKSETILSKEALDHNSILRHNESRKPHKEPNVQVLDVIVEKILSMETSLLNQEIKFEKFRSEAEEEVKTLRNATLLLLDIVSGKGRDCQGIRDTATKIKILYAALAAYEPSLHFPIFEGEEETYPIYDEVPGVEDSPSTSTTTGTTFMMTEVTINSTVNSEDHSNISTSDYKNNNLESRDLVLQSYNKRSTLTYKNTSPSSVTEPLNTSIYKTFTDIMTTPSTTKLLPKRTILPKRAMPSTTKSPTITSSPLDFDVISSSSTETQVSLTKPTTATRKTSKMYNKYKKNYSPIVCPLGSRLVGRECFSVHLDIRLNWTSARTYCRNLGGDLAEPVLNNEKLPRQLLKSWPALKDSSYWTLWVGGTDQEKEGEWHWVTGGILDLNKSPRWNVGEPEEEGETQDCLAMILWVPGRWQRWDLLDDPCDLKWHFFCEYSP